MSLVPWWCIFFYVTGCHSHMHKEGSSWNGYEFHTYPHPAKKTIIPRDTMVDVINNLGLKLLAIHNEYNENNIAISPYGALSVLVALGEGLEGDAVHEIQQATHLPNDISVIRVGLRDIHRHLKSYFIPKEGFLAGLTLNHENVTLRPEYEEILKFYGYDTVSFNNALFPQPETTEKPQTTSRGQTPTTTYQTTTETVAISTDLGKSATGDATTTEITIAETTETTKTTTEAEPISTITTTEKSATTLDVSTISTLPQSAVTEAMTAEPKTIEITSTNVPTTTMEATTKGVTTTEGTMTEIPTTTEEITEGKTTLPSATTDIVPEETTYLSRTTREEPTTTDTSTTEAGTISTETPSTSFTTMEDSTTELTTIETVLTTLRETTTTTTPTQTQYVTTQLPISSTPITSTELFTSTDGSTNTIEEESTPSATETMPSESTYGTNTVEEESTPSATETMPSESTDGTNAVEEESSPSATETMPSESTDGTNAVEEESTPSTTEAMPSESTDGTTVVDTLTVPIPSTVPSADVPDEVTETSTSTEVSTVTDSSVNEIDATDSSMENVGFGGVVKRKIRGGESIKGTNVVELNMRADTDGKRNSRSVVDYIIARYYDDHYVRHRHQRPYIPKEELSFLIYGKYREYNINFMKYDTVLPFFYVPHLHTLALSFPLDSTKYYLLLMLPVDETGIDKLVCDLRLNGSLRYIIANLRNTHVVATIPSFTLKGYVTLTPSFQKLGIRKVFEPRQADFTPMTNQSHIYVTNIEQAITVTIRNYVDPETMDNYRNLHQYDPVYFKADHPFLYFVIDTEIHVTLMAGKIVNPLNSRIS